ncbi:hypothetical protein E4U42_005459 [Claviceps africana]|uniref:Uncharacterized protein n=1 Tax=Claviceps africana TaxID=83212 RepID=A0A8K0J478_9HYPO|nr:hypothetical protein E4U42_005459 [Claviceps africana]
MNGYLSNELKTGSRTQDFVKAKHEVCARAGYVPSDTLAVEEQWRSSASAVEQQLAKLLSARPTDLSCLWLPVRIRIRIRRQT